MGVYDRVFSPDLKSGHAERNRQSIESTKKALIEIVKVLQESKD